MNSLITRIAVLLFLAPLAKGQTDTIAHVRTLVPLEEYVRISLSGGTSPQEASAYTSDELQSLKVGFDREKIRETNGPQFITITTSIFSRNGSLHDKVTQYAFTFSKQTAADEDMMMKAIAEKINPYNFTNKRKIDTIDVYLDSLPPWSLIEVKVTPDVEFTKYERRSITHRVWYYRTKGSRIESAFFLGIPKVLYDTEKHDTITYGNASAMLRFNYLDGETGDPYPFNFGFGTFGVSTPIDVSSKGGGFAVSFMFDVVRAFDRLYDWNIANRVNAGIELTPFFPINHRARILINARIGISP